MLHTKFDILDNPWWNEITEPKKVSELLESISSKSDFIRQNSVTEDPDWKDWVEDYHAKYLVECLAGESNVTKLDVSYVEKLMKDESFCGQDENEIRRRNMLKNLDQAVKKLFPNVCSLQPSPLNDLNIEFVKNLHHEVGNDGVIPSAGKFRTRNVKAAKEPYDHIYLNPDSIEVYLQNLLEECQQVFADSNLSLEDCVKYGACFLSEFLYIQPFLKGNGRTGRLLLSYFMIKHIPVPLPLYTSNTSRETYLQCLRETRKGYAEFKKPKSLSRFILENIEREIRELYCYLKDIGN